MKCTACGEVVAPGKKFCGECGASAGGVGGNVVNTGGGDVLGGLYQAGRDVVVNPPPHDTASATYEAVPKWRSPLTQGILSWLGLIVGVLSLLPVWKLVEPAIDLLTGNGAPTTSGVNSILWIAFFLVAVLMLALVLGVRGISKHQLRKPLLFGWAVSGAGHRITFEKIRAGKCPTCGGSMRYFNKPTVWIDRPKPNGGTRREVTERTPALECLRNPKHWFEVDPAEATES